MKKIWEQITRETWTKGNFARDRLGVSVSIRSPNAVKFCAVGWIKKVYQKASTEDCFLNLRHKFREANGLPDDKSIAGWNDVPERTFEEVLEAFKKADL